MVDGQFDPTLRAFVFYVAEGQSRGSFPGEAAESSVEGQCPIKKSLGSKASASLSQ